MNNEMEKSQDTVHAQPLCDIIEQTGAVRILMDLPGVNADTLDIDVKERQLHISAAMPGLWQGRKVEYRRSFQLSEDIDAAKISAKIRDGVLELTLPKMESAQVHKIAVARE